MEAFRKTRGLLDRDQSLGRGCPRSGTFRGLCFATWHGGVDLCEQDVRISLKPSPWPFGHEL